MSKALVCIELSGDTAKEVERYDMATRIRSALEGPGGSIWILEDERGTSGGRLFKLLPR